MQRRVLVPLDGSTLADRIITQLRRLLVRSDHELVLLTVVPEDAELSVVARADAPHFAHATTPRPRHSAVLGPELGPAVHSFYPGPRFF